MLALAVRIGVDDAAAVLGRPDLALRVLLEVSRTLRQPRRRTILSTLWPPRLKGVTSGDGGGPALLAPEQLSFSADPPRTRPPAFAVISVIPAGALNAVQSGSNAQLARSLEQPWLAALLVSLVTSAAFAAA